MVKECGVQGCFSSPLLTPGTAYLGLAGRLCPGERRGCSGRMGCDSFVYPAKHRTGTLASRSQSAATNWLPKSCSVARSQFAEATEEGPWQDTRPCLSAPQQAHLVTVHCHDSPVLLAMAPPDISPVPPSSTVVTSPRTAPPPPTPVPPSPLAWHERIRLGGQNLPSRLPGADLGQVAKFPSTSVSSFVL